MKILAFCRVLWYNVCMENREMQTSNTEEMVTISCAEYERLQQENAQLEAKSAKLEEAHARLEAKLAAREQEQAQVITIGKKAQEHYAKRQWPVVADYPGVAETMRISDTHEIVGSLVEAFCSGRADEVFLCYTEFVSPLQQEAKCIQLLPVSFERKENADKGGAHVLTEYDPSPEAVFNAVIPEYLYGVLYGAVVESYCSEQSARRMAMEAASDNAGEMIENLNLSYNRARQAAITQEITEIVAGSGEVGA